MGIILDGNRRWAEHSSYPRWLGHWRGAQTAVELLDWCLDLGIKTVTLYVLSAENLDRSKDEVQELLRVIDGKLLDLKASERIRSERVAVKALGRIELLPESTRKLLRELEEDTMNNENHFLNIAIAYGGRDEIIDVMRKIGEEIQGGKIIPSQITSKTVEEFLYTSHLPNPEPDLIIRTSGEERLSGFLLWQSAYSELVFIDDCWPDFRKIDLMRAIRTFQRRKRRFGR